MMYKLVVTICFAILILSHIESQDNELVPLYSGAEVRDVFWSADSQILTFMPLADAIIDPFNANWVVYDVVSSSESEIVGLPLQNMVLSQANQFSSSPMQLVSPDDAYIITASEQTVFDENLNTSQRQALRWNTVIIDTQNNHIVDPDILALGIDRGPEYFNALWSLDSKTLVLSTTALLVYDPSFFHWVTGYGDINESLQVQNLTAFSYQNQQYSMQTPLDLSLDGSNVLAITVSPTGVQGGRPLMIWNKDGKHINLQNVFDDISSSVTAAAFFPDNENDILVVDERGLVRYSLETSETVVLRSDITSQRFRYARFSPNGESLALVDNTPGRPATVYLLDIRDLAR
jgi:WD40 repeat protein